MDYIWILYIACILITLLLGCFLGYQGHKRRVFRQIRELSGDLEEMMRGEFKSLEKTVKEGEVSQLYSQVYTLCRKLEGFILRLESEKKDVKDYLVDISHQLKTPVTAISTYLQIMEEEETNTDKIEQMKRCIVLTDKVNQLIGNILKLARLESGAITFQIESFYLRDTVDEVFGMIQKSHYDTNVTLLNKVKEDVKVRYDESWFMEVLFNIVKNGILYGGDHPKIEVGCIIYKQVYGIWIKDNGPGIKKENLPHIFDRFHRGECMGEGIEKANTQGTGLGLAIAKAIVEKMHGRIEVVSNEEGTTFTIYLTVLVTASKVEQNLS